MVLETYILRTFVEFQQIDKEDMFACMEEALFAKRPLYDVLFQMVMENQRTQDLEIYDYCQNQQQLSFKEIFDQSTSPETGEKLLQAYQTLGPKGRASYKATNVREKPLETCKKEPTFHNNKQDEVQIFEDRDEKLEQLFDSDYLQCSRNMYLLLEKISRNQIETFNRMKRASMAPNKPVSKRVIRREEHSVSFANLFDIIADPNHLSDKSPSERDTYKLLGEEEGEDVKAEKDPLKKTMFQTAIKAIRQLDDAISPRKKIAVIQKATIGISNTFLKFLGESFGADELVPIFEYVLIHCNLKNLYSHLSFIQMFLDASLEEQMIGEMGYLLVSFEVALQSVHAKAKEKKK